MLLGGRACQLESGCGQGVPLGRVHAGRNQHLRDLTSFPLCSRINLQLNPFKGPYNAISHTTGVLGALGVGLWNKQWRRIHRGHLILRGWRGFNLREGSCCQHIPYCKKASTRDV